MPEIDMPASQDIGVIGIPFSKGQSRHGTDLAPQRFRDAGLIKKLEEQGINVTDYGDLPLETHPDDLQIGLTKNPKTVGAASEMIAKSVENILKENKTVLALGGDHSMAIGSIYGHWKAQPDVVIIWIDAHADINTPLTSGSGNMHGMPLSFLIKELDSYMPELPGLEYVKPCISAKNLAYIGLRDVDPGERKIIEMLGIPAYSMQEVDKFGIKEVVEMALKAVDPTGQKPIHLSFDVDALDPTLIPSTGTPVHGGLSLREGLYIAEEMAATGRMSVVDIAEVNPMLGDDTDVAKTLDMTLEIIQRCCGRRRRGAYPPGYTVPVPQTSS
ncbi:arginase-1-like [Argopecten irradians]|uniref:arginase-1-like n=1 Tax=Argopecten irradians TaxID=31199 RepID=UPI003722B1D7